MNNKRSLYTEPKELVQVTKPYFPSFMQNKWINNWHEAELTP